jgi:hypothetical protein
MPSPPRVFRGRMTTDRSQRRITMAEYQILTVLDCASILANVTPGTIGNEASLGSWGQSNEFVYMIASGDYSIPAQGQSELNLGVHAGDIVQWTVTDPTSGQAFSPILYGFTPHTGSTAISTPMMLNETLQVYQPTNVAQPTQSFTGVSYQDYVWEATIVAPKTTIQYTWNFVILDNNGNNKGAYTWDPFITVS